ncbi:Kef-type K+ transport system membrane component KefB [Kibdelosporangium banguiense]|uniref:Kef-type K+ transport system membrane component KefB n=1 Tax=Kibdelosporangium banguiense TaxID=1365924 RepID=A0ABS4TWA9_9PSEU|nr:cation:proton antiporter [Kibdelosporangium banguiense]MBP2328675.1 Kef-type K+ transport system membrane component KefB [Kibdelosporangium banguiense]
MAAGSDTAPRRGTLRAAGRLIAPYVLLVAVPGVLGVALLIGMSGSPDGTIGAVASGSDVVPKLLFALPVIFLACRLIAALFRRVGQPAVIGEIVAGVLLGPSLLGWLWPAAYQWILPDRLVPALDVLSQLGLVLFMFGIGHQLDPGALRRRVGAALLVSHVSIAIPFLSGILLALALYPSVGGGVGLIAFALFFAAALSITAFPVLARILTDRQMDHTPLASLALTCAAIDDVTAWCLLALVTAVAQGHSMGGTLVTVGLSLAFFVLMIWLVRPLLARLLGTGGRPGLIRDDAAVLVLLLGGLMLSALATDAIGIHAIFGAFLFGLITPRDHPAVTRIVQQLRAVTMGLLLPLFFVFTGIHTRFGLMRGSWALWGWCALIIVVAVLAKWVGSTVAARVSGIDRRSAWSLGALMNCRGLTELVVLNIGLSLGVISQTVFTMLVLMTLVSTVMTAPALSIIERVGRRRQTVPASAPEENPR